MRSPAAFRKIKPDNLWLCGPFPCYSRKKSSGICEHEKIFELFLFVVSEVSTGRRFLSLALFFNCFLLEREKKLHCEKTKIKNPASRRV
jgi:hypothetical protein